MHHHHDGKHRLSASKPHGTISETDWDQNRAGNDRNEASSDVGELQLCRLIAMRHMGSKIVEEEHQEEQRGSGDGYGGNPRLLPRLQPLRERAWTPAAAANAAAGVCPRPSASAIGSALATAWMVENNRPLIITGSIKGAICRGLLEVDM